MNKTDLENIIMNKAIDETKKDEKKNASEDDIKNKIKKRDEQKGNYKSDTEKKETQNRTLDYISAYNKKNYISTTINFKPEERVLLEVLSELSGESLTRYIARLIEQDKSNYPADEVQSRFDSKMQLINNQKKRNSSSIVAPKKQESKKNQDPEEVLQEAKEYFGTDPLTLPKTERLEFILYKTNNGEIKGDIQAYCNALDVSRAWFYQKVSAVNSEKKDIIAEIYNEAKEYFGIDPLTLPKTERLDFIIYKENSGETIEDIQAYCNALKISRTWYYQRVSSLNNDNNEIISEIRKEAEDYFHNDIIAVEKSDRAKYIVELEKKGKLKTGIQTYCNALRISRMLYFYYKDKEAKE